VKTILLAFDPDTLSAEQIAQVQALAPDRRVVVARKREDVLPLLDDIEIAVGFPPRSLLSQARALRWYQQWGAGADWLLNAPEAAASEWILTNASGVHALPISEHILAYIFAFARCLPSAVRAQARHEWHDPKLGVFEIAGKTLLLVGVGAIGARTAELASAVGMRVLGVRRDPAIHVPGVEAMFSPEQLLDVLPQTDVVALTVPLTRETRGLIGERELRAMKPSALLINIGRGGTIQEGPLIRALQEGWIAGAGLDVFETEPLPGDSPLWDLPNVLITGHYAGRSPWYTRRALAIFLDNLRRYLAGAPLLNVVDKQRGY